ncbi:HAMP domain-containing histidine kinase [Myxosarcina sp. GI1]|uniref:HAMP domain-containing histidine kinase n=1 Tax=Myxosarcina sp. GI1 TaxID=1541065 RepID=UPI00056C3537|nr:HAMP domain-containing histidine kinase [Myxosarcina sp. GI1]
MNQNSIFRSTRWRLTAIYTGVIGLLLTICGFGVWEAIAESHQGSIEVKSELGKGSTFTIKLPTSN